MKIRWTTILCLSAWLQATHLGAQPAGGLVYNGSFERHTSCPERIDALGIMAGVEAWWQPTRGSSDYFNSCGSRECMVPRNKMGTQPARTGEAYCGIYCSQEHYREYLQTELAQPLTAGRRYRVSFAVCLAEKSPHALATIGALLTHERITDTSWNILKRQETIDLGDGQVQRIAAPYSPQVENLQEHVLDNEKEWTTVSGELTAKGGERFLTIGNFRPFNQSHIVAIEGGVRNLPGAYYYIDDVSVAPADSCEAASYIPDAPAPTEGDIVVLSGIYFATGESEVLPQSHNTLYSLLQMLERNPSMKIELRGHTDNQGTAEFNRRLSQARAEAVASYLTQHGIDPRRLSSVGFGETLPSDTNATPEGRSKNRRVEYRITSTR